MGLDLTYKCIGNQQYEVYLSFYRDCNGINAPSRPTIDWSGSCGSDTIKLQQISQTDITPNCPGIGSSICSGGTGTYGIEEYIYKGILTIPANCNSVQLSYFKCCRNLSITTLTNSGSEEIYVEATIDQTTLCNSSPIFTNDPVPFVCANQAVLYNHGATDSDGDQLVYSLSNCYSNDGVSVQYMGGFSGTNPLNTTGGVSIDPSTGAISFTPQGTQVGVLCVLVEEFRNGQKIGSVVRDIQFNVVTCSNQVPTLSGIDNTTQYDTSVQVNNTLCFSVFSADVDSGQSTSIQWNSGIPTASFVVSGTTFQQGQFCWTPSNNDVGVFTFTVTVTDNYCPIIGQNTYTYSVEVLADPIPCDSIDLQLIATQDIQCSLDDGVATFQASNGSAPYLYQIVNWSSGNFYSNTDGSFNNLPVGNYSIWVADSQGCVAACTGQNFTIGGQVTPLQANLQVQNIVCPPTSPLGSNVNGTGSLSVGAVSGIAPYLFSIDGVNFQPTGFFDSLVAGTYSVVIIDDNGCSITIDTNITAPDPIQIQIQQLQQASCSANNGQVQIVATGGSAAYTFILDGNVQNSSGFFDQLAAGTYTLTVLDQNNCSSDTLIVIPQQSPGFNLILSSNNPTCAGFCNGTIAVTADDTTALISYVWSNGMAGSSLADLCAGQYEVTATGSQGCTQISTVLLNAPTALTLSVASLTDESCIGNDGAAQLVIQGGTAPYQLNLANFTNLQTYTSNNGQFNNLNQGNHFVQLIDANGCTLDCSETFILNGCTNLSNGPIASSNSLAAYLKVHPNPVKSVVQISYDSRKSVANILLIDASGKVVLNKNKMAGRGSIELSIDQLASSSYFVLLQNQQNETIKTAKLIIAH
jgi:hypothetical protein